jgi:hypothetical protein
VLLLDRLGDGLLLRAHKAHQRLDLNTLIRQQLQRKTGKSKCIPFSGR